MVITVAISGVVYMNGEYANIHTRSTQEIQDYL